MNDTQAKITWSKVLGYFSLSVLLFGLGFKNWIHIAPHINARFKHYNYAYPSAKQDFVIHSEPHDFVLPKFIQRSLALAFADRRISFDLNREPHLIVRSEQLSPQQARSAKYRTWMKPYLAYSGESWNLKARTYKENAPPFMQFVAKYTNKSNEVYVPFIAWCGVSPKKSVQTSLRNKFLAYINSNCVGHREKLFRLIKQKNPNAEALGLCSNPKKTRYPANWGSLDQVYQQYKFAFALENAKVPGYITEKILVVLKGGAIPIYWGDTKAVNSLFNPRAFINADDFKNLEQLADYIVSLNQNPQALAKMLSEPMFVDNKLPSLLQINTDPKHPKLQEAATIIRREYFNILARDAALK